jgi:hypothetical protein
MQLVIEDLAGMLLEAESVIERAEKKLQIANEMVSVLLTDQHELMQQLRSRSEQLYKLREEFYGLRKQYDDARRGA